jgi:hypothetical protein
LEPVLSGLTQPLFLTHAHDGTNRKFIVEQPGRILVMQPESSTTAVFLDIRSRVLSGGERGLLGLAFHPQYAANGRLFVNYTRQPDGATVIAEYHASNMSPNAADPASEVVLLLIPQPFDNHNGGMVEFGPDGFLYIGMGDGGSGNDPGNRAQNVNELLGKILRIDVDKPASSAVRYSSPSSNPFFGPVAGRDEIFATGFRNPFRFSFDRLNGRLFAGDVGQSTREEIDIVTKGGNYGWRVLEGTFCTGLGPVSCSVLPALRPVTEYVRQSGRCAVTGGYVYRGSRRALPYGAYVFGDFCSGEIFVLHEGNQTVILDTSLGISSFGEDESGELYVVALGGSVSRITSSSSPDVTERQYSIPELGGVFLASNNAVLPEFSAGYARIQADSGNALPDGMLIFAWRQRGILVSEATLAASPLTRSGRIFALVSGSDTTGIAIANPNSGDATIDFHFTDASGQDFGNKTITIPANGQIAAFLNESPFNGGSTLDGTFTFRASIPVAAMAISGLYNERSEFLAATLPIVPIDGTVLEGTMFPHFAQGGGWTTEFLLVNPSDAFVTGIVNLTDPAGQPGETLSYSIPSRSSRRLAPATEGANIRVGSARITSTGGALPSGAAVFRLSANEGTVTQSGVPAIAPGFAFRGYGELSTSVRTALAVVNLNLAPATVTVELRDLDGTLRETAAIDIPPSGQRALFLDEISGLASVAPFQGIIRVSSAASIAVTALRSRVNERGDFLITASPPRDESELVPGTELYFPHLAIGNGYDMQFVLINSQSSGVISGTMSFFASDGEPLPLAVP